MASDNEKYLPWAVWDGHVVDSRGPNGGCVAFNVGTKTAQFIVDRVNNYDKQVTLHTEEESRRWELETKVEQLQSELNWHKKRDDFLEAVLAQWVRCVCGGDVRRERLTWAHPRCDKCVPPPPPLETFSDD